MSQLVFHSQMMKIIQTMINTGGWMLLFFNCKKDILYYYIHMNHYFLYCWMSLISNVLMWTWQQTFHWQYNEMRAFRH